MNQDTETKIQPSEAGTWEYQDHVGGCKSVQEVIDTPSGGLRCDNLRMGGSAECRFRAWCGIWRKLSALLIILPLCSCQDTRQGLQIFNLWPKPTYSAAEYYKAEVMGSGTKARTAERIDYVMAHKPPRSTEAKILEAIEWPDLETLGKP